MIVDILDKLTYLVAVDDNEEILLKWIEAKHPNIIKRHSQMIISIEGDQTLKK